MSAISRSGRGEEGKVVLGASPRGWRMAQLRERGPQLSSWDHATARLRALTRSGLSF